MDSGVYVVQRCEKTLKTETLTVLGESVGILFRLRNSVVVLSGTRNTIRQSLVGPLVNRQFSFCQFINF